MNSTKPMSCEEAVLRYWKLGQDRRRLIRTDGIGAFERYYVSPELLRAPGSWYSTLVSRWLNYCEEPHASGLENTKA